MRAVFQGQEAQEPLNPQKLVGQAFAGRSQGHPPDYLPDTNGVRPLPAVAPRDPRTQELEDHVAHFLLWRKTQRALDESDFHMKCSRICHFNMPQGESWGRGKAPSELGDLKVRFSSLSLCPELFRETGEERQQTALFLVKIKNDPPASLENIPPVSRCGWEQVSAPLPSTARSWPQLGGMSIGAARVSGLGGLKHRCQTW